MRESHECMITIVADGRDDVIHGVIDVIIGDGFPGQQRFELLHEVVSG
jgi:hypothetical protein